MCYSYSGSHTDQGVSHPDGPAVVNYPVGTDGIGSGDDDAQNNANCAADISVTATFYYVPDSIMDTPPATLNIREEATAHWLVEAEHVSISGTGSAQNGKGDGPVAFSDYEDIYARHGEDAHGIHLKQISVAPSSGTIPGTTTQYTASATVPDCSLSASAQTTGDNSDTSYYEGVGAEAYVMYAAALDGRSAAIHANVEASFYKLGTDKIPWIPGEYDDTKAGDAVAIWDIPFHAWEGDSRFSVTANGFNSPTYSWTPGGTLMEHVDATQPSVNCHFNLSSDNKATSLGTTTTTCNVTDSDGATATKTYIIQWHVPCEPQDLIDSVLNPKEKMDGPLNEDPCYPGLPPIANSEDGRASPEKDIDIGAGIEGVGAIAAASGDERDAAIAEILGKLCDAADLKYHYGGQPEQTYTNNQDLWNTCVDTPAQSTHNVDDPRLLTMRDPVTGQLNGFEQTTMQIWIVKYTRHKRWHADYYDAHGYTNSGIIYGDPIDDPNGIKPEPFYVSQNQH